MSKYKVSIIVTTRNEPKTIAKCVSNLTRQLSLHDELLLVSPDTAAKRIIGKDLSTSSKIKFIKDAGKGKPSALNVAFRKAKNNILVLTDGDVIVDRKALEYLLRPYADKSVGAVTGHPVSANKKNNMFGYWSHILADAAHKVRMDRLKNNSFLECSGYLYSFRRDLINKVPDNALSEDAVVSHLIANKGYKITYAPKAYVRVKYPDNFSDWIKQKVRSAGGYTQDYISQSSFKMRTPISEITKGVGFAMKYPKDFQQLFWTICLFLARVYLWVQVYIKIKLIKKSFSSLWLRVESTK